MELRGIKVNFLGDSITEGVGASEYAKCYVSQFEKITGATCRNYGISGTRIARQQKDLNPAYDKDFCMRVEEMSSDADVIVVFGGTNDYGHGDASFGEFSDRDANTFCGAVHVLFKSLMEKYPLSKILVLTPLHRLDEDDANRHGLQLKAYVEALRKIAEQYSLDVLDLYKSSGIQPNIPVNMEKYMPDGLHPSDLGHRLIAERIAAYLHNTWF